MRYFDSARIDDSPASKEYIRSTYRALVKKYHPDRAQGNAAIMEQVNLEYAIAQQGLDISAIVKDKTLHRPLFDFLVLLGSYSMLTFCVGNEAAPPKVITMLQQLVKHQREKILNYSQSQKSSTAHAHTPRHRPS